MVEQMKEFRAMRNSQAKHLIYFTYINWLHIGSTYWFQI